MGIGVGYSELLNVSSMICPHCQSQRLQKLKRTTDLGYSLFRCSDCGCKSNEGTGTTSNFLEFPTDIVFEVVLCRLRYKLSLRNLAEMFLLRGFQFTHESRAGLGARFAPLLAEQWHKGKVGRRTTVLSWRPLHDGERSAADHHRRGLFVSAGHPRVAGAKGKASL
jgi:hypothetical protein